MRVSFATDSSRSLRSAPDRGKKPSNTNRPAGRPLSVTAMIAAEGPGVAVTVPPASMTARTIRSPGSLIPGLPASVMSATVLPAETSAEIFSRESCSVCSFTMSKVFSLTPMRCRSLLECRVSSQQITSASRSASTARAVMSCRLPIGVATSTRRPVIRVLSSRATSSCASHLDHIADFQAPALERPGLCFDDRPGLAHGKW